MECGLELGYPNHTLKFEVSKRQVRVSIYMRLLYPYSSTCNVEKTALVGVLKPY
jgi:hypothetical protein